MKRTRALVFIAGLLLAVLVVTHGQTPAPDLTGTWSGPAMMSRGKDLFTLVLAREGGSYAGTMSDAMGLMERAPIEGVKFSDGTLRFSFTASLPNRDLRLEATLKLENGRLVGVWAAESGDTGALELERKGALSGGAPPTGTPPAGTKTARELEKGRGYKVPNAGLFTTVRDLARFVSFQLGEGPEAVLSRATRIENLTRTNSSMLDLTAGYGIGFMVNRRGNLVIYGHAGDVAGYSAVAQFERTSRAGVIVLSNAPGGQLRVGPLADRLLEIMVAAAK